ncbi:MAG TPA: FtsX-like permease family protein [Bacteroidia bacterium]|nr:FtsX-like permease family protein [Bacteroidia bacterium]
MRSVNTEIALTHILTRKRQTIVASFGVAIGIAIYICLNTLIIGTNRYSDNAIFKTTPHIRVYKEDDISKPLSKDTSGKNGTIVIVNPKISNISKNLINPGKLLHDIKNQPEVTAAAPMVTANIFYNNGKSQLTGVGWGLNIIEGDAMFDIQSTMVVGDLRTLLNTPNGIIIGVGIADKLNIKLNDNISVISSVGVIKLMKVVGFFKSSNAVTDKSKSYMNLATAQQLLEEGPNYVTDIYVKIKDPEQAVQYATVLGKLTGYSTEDWKAANELFVAGKKIRAVMFLFISWAILLVAAFGIYNILNMTVSQKLNDIANLKANGFSGKDVVRIFVMEAMVMGIIGTFIGFVLSSIIVNLLSRIYIGADIGYFPIQFEFSVSMTGVGVGLLVTFFAGYIPARKASKVDPVAIFRK